MFGYKYYMDVSSNGPQGNTIQTKLRHKTTNLITGEHKCEFCNKAFIEKVKMKKTS